MRLREQGSPASDLSGALLGLVSKVGDGSNLILDPDLDSYYVMDLQVIKLPAFMLATAHLLDRLKSAGSAPADEDRIAIVAEANILAVALDGIRSSYASAIASNADGEIAAALQPRLDAFNAAAVSYLSAVDAVITKYSAKSEISIDPVSSAQTDLVGKSDALLGAVNTDLTRLLEVRIAGFNARMLTMLGLAAGLVVLVLVASAVSAASILKAIRRLVEDITSVADQAENASIRDAESRDEIGSIARAAAYLRDQTVERLVKAEQLRLDQEQEARLAAEENSRLRQEDAAASAQAAIVQAELVAALSNALSSLARGELDCIITRNFPGELDEVRLNFNATIETLAEVIAGLKQTSGLLKEATGEILAGTNDLA
ncbi:MAG TPA: hypothetical protein VGB81_15195, partial [Devosia sp.]